MLSSIDQKSLSKFLGLLREANRVFVYGSGRSGLVGRAFAIRLAHLGIQSYVIGETICAPVKKNDLVIIISGSGKTMPSVMTAEIAKDIGAHIVIITTKEGQSFSKKADAALIIDVQQDEKRGKLAPLGSLFESASWLLFDGIISELMEQIGETEHSMRKRHATLQ